MGKKTELTKKKIILENIKAVIRDLMIGCVLYSVIHFFFKKYEESLLRFLENQAISILGVMLPINIAGLGQAHISMNGIEEKRNKKIDIFDNVRFDLKITLALSIFSFLLSVISCVVIGIKNQSSYIKIPFIALYLSCFVFSLQCLYETYCKGIFEIPAIINDKGHN